MFGKKNINLLFAVFMPIWIILISGCMNFSDRHNQVRQPVVAGSHYPEKNKDLNQILVKAFRTAPPPEIKGQIKGILVPHAAYQYSGVISAMAMKSLVNKTIDTIYILGTSHYTDVGGAIIWQGRAWRTPLGLYPVDNKAVRELLKNCPDIHLLPRAWTREHSVEVQLPFLQTVAPEAKFVPIIMGTATWAEIWSVAQAIARQAQERQAVVVISTDLSHYPDQKNAEIIDKKVLSAMEKLDIYKLDEIDSGLMAQGISNLICTVCGLSAVKTGILAVNLMGANQGQKIYYANSGMITGDKDKVVGYGAMAFIENPGKKSWNITLPKNSNDWFGFSQQDTNELLSIARAAITEGLATGTQLRSTTAKKKLLQKYSVYVTLKKNGKLRGSVGLSEPRLPLHQAVAQMACAAAFQDIRFEPLESQELPYTDIELSILSPMTRVINIKDIIIGVHGVMLKRGDRQGLYLPQVATGNNWSKEELLSNLCRQKVKIPADAWRDKSTEIYSFKVKTVIQSATGLNP